MFLDEKYFKQNFKYKDKNGKKIVLDASDKLNR